MGIASLMQTILYYLLTGIGWIYNPVTHWILSQVYDSSAKTVSPVTDELLLISATDLAEKIRTREASLFGRSYINFYKIPMKKYNS